MFTNYGGELVEGSNGLLVSVANAEIITQGNIYVNFTLQVDTACHVFINGSTNAIYLRAGVGYSFDRISSLKIQEATINYTWIGTRA